MAQLARKHFCAIPLVLAGLVLLVVAIVLHVGTGGDIPFDYGIVLDAGSSHTEVTLFKWLGDQVQNTGVVFEVVNCETHDGIDDNEEHINVTLHDLMPCVRKVTSSIDFDDRGSTPIFLGATAGMRLLQLKKPLVAELIFASITSALQNYQDDEKRFSVEQVRVLSGSEEGLFAWIAANFLLDNFPTRSESSQPSQTVGILDMGGASAQIAYQDITPSSNFSGEEVAETRLYGEPYRVRSTSNLCWGGDEAILRHLALLVLASSPDTTELSDPCLNRGATRIVSSDDFVESVCLRTVSGKPLFAEGKNYTFRGLPSTARCNAQVARVLDAAECSSTFVHCPHIERQAPPTNMSFYAFSTYYYATRALPLHDNISLVKFTEETEKFCLRGWQSIIDAAIHKPKYAMNYCFHLNYIKQTLSKLYLLDSSHWEHLHFVKYIGSQTAGWALGMMINATNALSPLDETPPVIRAPTFIAFILIATFLVIVAIIVSLKKPSGQTRTN